MRGSRKGSTGGEPSSSTARMSGARDEFRGDMVRIARCDLYRWSVRARRPPKNAAAMALRRADRRLSRVAAAADGCVEIEIGVETSYSTRRSLRVRCRY